MEVDSASPLASKKPAAKKPAEAPAKEALPEPAPPPPPPVPVVPPAAPAAAALAVADAAEQVWLPLALRVVFLWGLTAGQLRNQIQDLVSNLMGMPRPPGAAGEAGAPAAMQEPEAELVQQLADMGFTQGRARKALILNRSSFQAAMDWLLEHNDDPVRCRCRAERPSLQEFLTLAL